ncbi:MAG: hypothetical protein L3J66_00035 [Bacteroidales bacterium]|nr:hypothetical protein [Bacteroidales bacterium]
MGYFFYLPNWCHVNGSWRQYRLAWPCKTLRSVGEGEGEDNLIQYLYDATGKTCQPTG